MLSKKILVSGVSNGLGHAAHTMLGGLGIKRDTNLSHIDVTKPYDAIIHCAVNSSKNISVNSAMQYFYDNVLLTQRLLKIPHRKFVYISTVDIYDKELQTPAIASYDYTINLSRYNLYSATKLMSECLVRDSGKRYLILRPVTLMGPVMRANTIVKLLTQPNCSLFLSPKSEYNIVLHQDIVDFINFAIDSDVEGVFNVASTDNLVLENISSSLGLNPKFGNFLYKAGLIDQTPISDIYLPFKRSSAQTLNLYIDSLGDRYIGNGRLS